MRKHRSREEKNTELKLADGGMSLILPPILAGNGAYRVGDSVRVEPMTCNFEGEELVLPKGIHLRVTREPGQVISSVGIPVWWVEKTA